MQCFSEEESNKFYRKENHREQVFRGESGTRKARIPGKTRNVLREKKGCPFPSRDRKKVWRFPIPEKSNRLEFVCESVIFFGKANDLCNCANGEL